MSNLELLTEALDYAFSNCIGVKTPEKIAQILENRNAIILPCKIGDTVYKVNYNHCCTDPNLDFYDVSECKFSLDMYNDIGFRIYLTKDEAEKKGRVT